MNKLDEINVRADWFEADSKTRREATDSAQMDRRYLLELNAQLVEALREIGNKVPCINHFGFCASCHARAALEKVQS